MESPPADPPSPLPFWCRSAAYVVCRDDERVLLTRFEQQHNPDSGSWTLPGGGIEFGEQPAEAAHREFFEETGLTVTLGNVIATYSTWFDVGESISGEPGHALSIMFAGTRAEGSLRIEFPEGESTVEARWFTLDEVRELTRVPIVDIGIGASG